MLATVRRRRCVDGEIVGDSLQEIGAILDKLSSRGKLKKDVAKKNLRIKSVFLIPIDSFPPEAELILALGSSWTLFGENTQPNVSPTQFNVTAVCEFLGKKVGEVNRVDLRQYMGSAGERNPVVEELEKIRKSMEQKK